MSYCVFADLSPFLPAGGVPNPSLEAYGHASSDEIESAAHGLADDDAVTFRAHVGGSVPTGLTAGVVYYAIVQSTDRFKVSATSGGAAVAITGDGDNFTFTADPPWDAWMEAAARDCDGIISSYCGSHVVPVIAPYPPQLVSANAELAVERALKARGGSSIDFGARLESVQRRLAPWAKSLALRGTAASNTSPVNLAITASAGAVDPRGWASAGNTVLP